MEQFIEAERERYPWKLPTGTWRQFFDNPLMGIKRLWRGVAGRYGSKCRQCTEAELGGVGPRKEGPSYHHHLASCSNNVQPPLYGWFEPKQYVNISFKSKQNLIVAKAVSDISSALLQCEPILSWGRSLRWVEQQVVIANHWKGKHVGFVSTVHFLDFSPQCSYMWFIRDPISLNA